MSESEVRIAAVRSSPGPVWRAVPGLLLGAVTAGMELVLLAGAAPLMAYCLVFSRGRRTVPPAVAAGAGLLTELERRRLKRFLGEESAAEYGPPKALAYLVLRVPTGLLGGVFGVHSPPGGPTVITAELPCG